jgi:phospholipid/cholesterol/gamma-HCH transport system substrate-binding protein
MQSRALEVLVGFFVCLGISAIFLLTFRVASLNSISGAQSTYAITANFDNIGSLKVGAPVKIAGVVIGRVHGISIDPKSFEAVANLDIGSQYNDIPRDSVAKILTAGLLGEQYIGIEPGGDDQALKSGDRLKLTQSAMVLENLIGQMLTSVTQKSDKPAADSPAK